MSVHHDDVDAGSLDATNGSDSGASTGNDPLNSHRSDSPEEARATCSTVCGQCLSGVVPKGGCDSFCNGLIADAQTAECASALGSLLSCYEKSNEACTSSRCPTETNAFTVCILEYCDMHAAAPVCVAPL